MFDTERATLSPNYPKRAPVGRGLCLLALGHFLPAGWEREVKNCALAHAEHIARTTPGPDSLDPAATLDYWVVNGNELKAFLPWLYALYNDESFHRFVATEMGVEVVTPAALKGGANINMLAGRGEEYEWHLDAEPFTLVLFASTLHEGDGGEFLYVEDGVYKGVRPSAGVGVCFDGSAYPHKVRRLARDVLRLSVVLEFITPSDRVRAKELDSYLY